MIDERDMLESVVRRFEPEPGLTERVYQRRDRKRRSQRIAAGLVGVAAFVVAIWILTSVGSLDRTQGPAGRGTTGSVETGPGVSGPVGNGPTPGPSPTELDVNGTPGNWGPQDRLPPAGSTPSQPQHGEVVTSDWGFRPEPRFVASVYADGRVIWFREYAGTAGPLLSPWIEQRLTPEGIGLLESGAVPLGGQYENPGEQLPASAWEDATLGPYVPSTYAVCGSGLGGHASASGTLSQLQGKAVRLLEGTQRIFHEVGRSDLDCFEVSTEHARALAERLVDRGWYQSGLGPFTFLANTPGLPSLILEFAPVLPDGRIVTRNGG